MAKLVKIHQNTAWDNKAKKEWENRSIDSQKVPNTFDVEFMMTNQNEALRCHIDNLVLTYGMKAVRDVLEKTSLNTVKKAKKVG